MRDNASKALENANAISELIINSDEYTAYTLAYKKIQNDPRLIEKINFLKYQHLEFIEYNKDDFNKEKYISQELYKAMLDEDVKQFFISEDKLITLMYDIFTTIGKNINMDFLI